MQWCDGQDEEEVEHLLPVFDVDEDERTRTRRWSLQEAVDLLGVGRFHVLLVLVCGWANASDSVEVQCVSLILTSVQCDLDVSSSALLGLLTAVIFVGMMIGGYVWGSIGDIRGRRVVMITALFVNAIFGFLSSFANSFWLFLVLRFLSGLGVGGSIPVIWSYFSEFQPANIRGRMLSLLATFWMVGQLLTAGLAWIFIPRPWLSVQISTFDLASWRIFIILSTFVCLSAAVAVCFLPESPKFLSENGKAEKALDILADIYQMNTGNSKCDFRVRKLEEAERAPIQRGSFLKQTGLLFRRPLLPTTVAMVVINFTLAFGAYGLTLWLPELFTRARESGHEGPICRAHNLNSTSPGLDCSHPPDQSVFRDSFLIALASLPGNLLSIALLDRWGRKRIFFCGAALSAVSAFMVWFVSDQVQVLLMSCVFSGFSVLCWNCLDCFSTELFPTVLRATSMGVCLGVARVGAILGNLVFGALLDTHCAVPIVTVAVMLAIAALVSLRLKETTNIPLE